MAASSSSSPTGASCPPSRARPSSSWAAPPRRTSFAPTTRRSISPSCRRRGSTASRTSSHTAPPRRSAPRRRRSSRCRSRRCCRIIYEGPLVSAKPRVVIPVFPGNNCEYDTARAFERVGAVADVFVVNNLTPAGGRREHARAGAPHPREPDRHDTRRLLRRRRARRLGQVHHRVLPRARGHRGGARVAAEARRFDAGHLQRLPGARQAGVWCPTATSARWTRIARR